MELGGGYVLEVFVLGPLRTNTYLLSCGDAAILVDPAPTSCSRLLPRLRSFEDGVTILVTHAHFDHASDASRIRRELGGPPQAPVALHELDKSIYPVSKEVAPLFGVTWEDPVVDISIEVVEGSEVLDVVSVDIGTEVRAIHTPGHTPGSVTYYLPEVGVAFTGDTLFRGTVGRTDFPGGDPEAMVRSLRRLAEELPPETKVFPGHGPSTTMGDELRGNEALRRALGRD